jgi:hypothetical protein
MGLLCGYTCPKRDVLASELLRMLCSYVPETLQYPFALPNPGGTKLGLKFREKGVFYPSSLTALA